MRTHSLTTRRKRISATAPFSRSSYYDFYFNKPMQAYVHTYMYTYLPGVYTYMHAHTHTNDAREQNTWWMQRAIIPWRGGHKNMERYIVTSQMKQQIQRYIIIPIHVLHTFAEPRGQELYTHTQRLKFYKFRVCGRRRDASSVTSRTRTQCAAYAFRYIGKQVG